jgi:hypothetical protein
LAIEKSTTNKETKYARKYFLHAWTTRVDHDVDYKSNLHIFLPQKGSTAIS